VTRITVLTVGLLALAACGGSNGYSTGPSMGGGGGGGGSTAGKVTVINDAFTPSTVHPDSLGSVVWTWNSGRVQHNVTFEGAITGSGNKTSGTFAAIFTTPGTYRFRCTIHSTDFSSGMHGSVVVP